jgi:acetyl esterase/lipase
MGGSTPCQPITFSRGKAALQTGCDRTLPQTRHPSFPAGTRRELNDWLARQGYAVASIDYRLCPEHKWPAQREDLLEAIEFLRAHATALGIDQAQFVLLGRSAGGQIATATAYWQHDPTIRGVVALYPPTDFRRT